MIEPTDEMERAYDDAAWENPVELGGLEMANVRAGLAAVLAIVERDYHIEPRSSEGSAVRCGCPPELCYGRTARRPGQECGAVLDRGAS